MEVHVSTRAPVPLDERQLWCCIYCIYGPRTRLSDLRSDTLCAAFTWLSYIALIEKTATVTSLLYWFVHPTPEKKPPRLSFGRQLLSSTTARWPRAVNSCKRACLSVIDCNGRASIYPDHGMIKPVVIRPAIYISPDEV